MQRFFDIAFATVSFGTLNRYHYTKSLKINSLELTKKMRCAGHFVIAVDCEKSNLRNNVSLFHGGAPARCMGCFRKQNGTRKEASIPEKHEEKQLLHVRSSSFHLLAESKHYQQLRFQDRAFFHGSF